MSKRLISEFQMPDSLVQLIVIPYDAENLQIIIDHTVDQGSLGRIHFWWNESAAVIQGFTEVLITKHGELNDELIVGLLGSKFGETYFSWISNEDDYALKLSQGDENIHIDEVFVIEYFRWIRHSLQLVQRMVS